MNTEQNNEQVDEEYDQVSVDKSIIPEDVSVDRTEDEITEALKAAELEASDSLRNFPPVDH